MPAFAIEHHAIRFAQPGLFFQAVLDARHDAALFFLTLGVQLVEPSGNLPGTLHVFLVEKFDHVAGRARPSPSFATSSSALRPTFTGRRSPCSPSFANTRFSPSNGTASAMDR